MIRVITIEREYGCGGGAIAKRVAERLGWALWDHQMTCEIARLANCERSEVEIREERVDPLYYRLLKSVLRGSFEGSLNLHRLHCLDAESMLRLTKQVTEQAASAGNCVIVGRGSQYHLRQRTDTLRIFLFAPPEEKIRRLKSEGISQAEAEALVDSIDKERADFMAKYFHQQWPNRHLYHAMLNTTAGEEVVTETILDLKEELAQHQLSTAFENS
ncbi:MAG TPA: cytidylate kinase-like family protein [Terriglobales bacterium]|jgi:cytidylate kinase|nr:cytidylate kinase-like family protein [Terriglobales bacterium]